MKSPKSLLTSNKVSTNSKHASNEFLNSNDINMNNDNSSNIKNSFKNKKINTLKSSDNDEKKLSRFIIKTTE